MTVEIEKMIDFAAGKADSFLTDAEAQKERIIMLMTGLIAAMIILGLISSIFISRSIVIPLSIIVERISNLSRGYLKEDIDIYRKDEVGLLADSFRELQKNLLQKTRLLEQIASGDFSTDIPPHSDKDDLGKSFFAMTTSLRKTTAELVSSELKYSNLTDVVPIGISVSMPDGRVIEANRSIVKMFGFDSKEEFVSCPVADHYYYPEDRNIFFELYKKGMVKDLELRFKRKDGTLFWCSVTSISQRTTEEGTLNINTILEITERKRAEESLRESEEQLRQAQKLESVGRLAGGVAHDFNNLLTTIIGYSEFISMEQDLNDTTKEGLQEINKSARRAAELTRQLLAFSRKQILQPQVIELNRLITKLGRMLRRLIGEDIDLTTKLDSKLGHIKADPGQVEQVITNLVVNARDAMPEGGTLTIETQGLYLDESYHQQHPEVTPGDYVLLAVRDTGHGMDKKTQAQVFEPFFTTKEVGKGTGLGLSMVYGIVKQSGGYIWVYSEPNHGTTFKIYLPQLSGTRKQQESPGEKKDPMGGAESILLVEDEESLRKMARKILEGYGYSVVEATDGMDALEIINKAEHPAIDLLVTDVIMPIMGGKELSEKLFAEYPRLRVLYISGYTDNAFYHHRELDKGVSILKKPFSSQSLAEKVREVLDKSQG